MQLLATRRSPKLRSLSGPPPSAAQIDQMLTIASRVPDHGKIVPWRFIIIEGTRRDDLNEAIRARFPAVFPDADPEKRTESGRRMSYAPLVIAVVSCPCEHPKVPEWEQQLCAGAVCMNLLHAARGLGFAGLWLTEWYARDPVVLGALGVQQSEQVAGFLHIGSESQAREDRARPVLENIVSRY